MAKKGEVYEGLDPDELEDEELELLEEEKPAKGMRQRVPARKVPETIKKRYKVFEQTPRLGIVDAETGEVVAEGDVNTIVLETLANILERLERIETNIGSFVGR